MPHQSSLKRFPLKPIRKEAGTLLIEKEGGGVTFLVVDWTGLVYYVILLFLLVYLVYGVCRFFIRNREMQRQHEEQVLRRLDELLEINRELLKHYKKDNS